MGKYLDLFQSLKLELRFLESGGYEQVATAAGREARIFEDSPVCPNYDNPADETPCSHCALMTLVPLEFRNDEAPCRHIIVNPKGETVDSVTRSGGFAAAERELRGWLKAMLQAIEHARIASMSWFPRSDSATKIFRA